MHTRISIQSGDFDVAQHYEALRSYTPGKTGAIACFVGLVREWGDGSNVQAIELEHYPGMTEKALETLIEEARGRWQLNGVHIVHRVGRLALDEQIVLVGVASSHRAEAFASCEFLMDHLKTRAPFWKKERSHEGGQWVEAKSTDSHRADKWNEKT